MDALALLCTLHADGPATLRRLRSLGCSDIRAFATRDALEIADDLDIEPAAARRLVREARILAERIGDAVLEAEEAPSVPTRSVPEPSRPAFAEASHAPSDSTTLDRGDLDLVARIVAGGGGAPEQDLPAAAAPEEAESVRQSPAQVPPTAEPLPAELLAGGEASVEEAQPVDRTDAEPEDRVPHPTGAQPEPDLEPAAVSDAVAEVLHAPEAIEEELHGALTTGCLPGLDQIMLEDLQAAGICTLAELGGAESLNLTRNLGVTFAQARRLRFLARRAATELPVAPKVLTPTAAQAPVAPSVAPAALDVAPVPQATAPQDLAPVEDEVQVADSEPVQETVIQGESVPAPEPRRPFWEPRGFLVEETKVAPEPQGVRVDPSEIEARPRFGDQFAKAALEGKARREDAAGGHTVLGWNFEIPRPDEDALPVKALGDSIDGGDPELPTAETAAGDAGSGEAAGPFA